MKVKGRHPGPKCFVRLRGSDGGLFKIGTFFGVRTLGGLCRHLS